MDYYRKIFYHQQNRLVMLGSHLIDSTFAQSNVFLHQNHHLADMKLTLSIVIASLVLSSCGPSQKQAPEIEKFPEQAGTVNDFENIFSDKEEKNLDSLMKHFEKHTNVEIAVVTVDSAITTLEDFNSYTLRLANAWEIGKKDTRNGILIGISASYQRVRINNGFGVNRDLSSVKTKNILHEIMFPELRKGNYYEGTKAAISEIRTILE